ncbi:MAG: class I SAM-dependent methyltransferase [Bryobacteraceae bacterium]
MLPEKLRSLFRGARSPAPGTAQAKPPSASWLPGKSGDKETRICRQSRGLEQFFAAIRGQSGLTVLDLGGASQANVSMITGLGHRLYSVDFLRSIEETFGFDDVTDQSNPGRIDYFLRQNLDYADDCFDGVLVWDVLEYMAPALLAATVERLHRVTRPGGYLLAFFHVEERLPSVPFYNFRIQDLSTLQVTSRGERRPVQLFNNRSLEKLFARFDSVKFFLTRERLREILVRR